MHAQKFNVITQMLPCGPDPQTTGIRAVQTARWATNSTQRGPDQKIEYSSGVRSQIQFQKILVANGTGISQQRSGQQISPKESAPQK